MILTVNRLLQILIENRKHNHCTISKLKGISNELKTVFISKFAGTPAYAAPEVFLDAKTVKHSHKTHDPFAINSA